MKNWEEARSKKEEVLKSKDSDRIKQFVKKMWNFEGRETIFSIIDPSELITINNCFGRNETVSIVHVLLQNNNLGQDKEFFEIAKEFLKQGASIPKMGKSRESFSSTADYLRYLSRDYEDLFIALCLNPAIVQIQDEDGKTILHHAASIEMDSNSTSLIHGQLFDSPLIDFTIQDNDGNTPLHLAAYHCFERVTCTYIFTNFISAAAQRRFDFSVLNKGGQAVIHLATRHPYEHPSFGRISLLGRLIKIVPNIDLNMLSSSGSTALFYAVNWGYWDEVKILLNAGADPTIFGSPDRDPVKQVDEYLKQKNILVGLARAKQEDRLDSYMQQADVRGFLLQAYREKHLPECILSAQAPTSDEINVIAKALIPKINEDSYENHGAVQVKTNLVIAELARAKVEGCLDACLKQDGIHDFLFAFSQLEEIEREFGKTAPDQVEIFTEKLLGSFLKYEASNLFPESEKLFSFAESVADDLQRDLEALQKSIADLENLRERMHSNAFYKAQEKEDRFPFWSRTVEMKAFGKVNTEGLNDDRSGPGYGF